jgi:hypothetical protein
MRRIVTIAASALLLAPGAHAAPPNACKLLAKGEVTRLIGSGATAAGIRIGAASSCVWTGAGGAAQGVFERNALTTPGAVVLHGIGESAFRVKTVLWVYAGRYRLMLASARIPSALAVETTIARIAAKRL